MSDFKGGNLMYKVYVKYKKTDNSIVCSSYYTHAMSYEDACAIENIIRKQLNVVYTEVVKDF